MVLGPVLRLYLRLRIALGKEDPARIGERYGRASQPRPPGNLFWLHAASVGEWQSVRILLDAVGRDYPHWTVLVTSGTVTSARLIAPLTHTRLLHQYVPLDHPRWVAEFLSHWRPQVAVMVESELWPNLIMQTKQSGANMLLLNARMSATSFASWQKSPGFIRRLLQNFSQVLAQDETYAAYFRELGAPGVIVAGNLKYAALPLPYAPGDLAAWREGLAGRPLWLLASSHAGEEALAGRAHLALLAQRPNLLTIIAPRHPERAEAIRRELTSMNLRVAQRSRGEAVDAFTQIYLADTMGEMGLWFALRPPVLMGNSVVGKGGGHNLLEPARFACPIMHGQNMQNFESMAQQFKASNASLAVHDLPSLVTALGQCLANPVLADGFGQRARALANSQDRVLDLTWQYLQSYLGPPVVEQKHANA